MSGLTVTFVEDGGAERVIADVAPHQSLMEVGRANGVEGILADCGGSCACGTCHVYVDDAWLEAVGTPDEVEVEMLDLVSEVRPGSRLSCQIRLSAALDGLRVTVAPTGF